MVSIQKKSQVDLINNLLKDRSNFLLIRIGKTTHQNLETLRKELKKTNSTFKVIKNTLFQKALNLSVKDQPLFKELKKKYFPLKYPSALITLGKDWSGGVKALYNFFQKEKSLSFKLALLDNTLYSDEETGKIAQLPGRDELIAKIISGFKSPTSKFVYSLKFNMNKFVYILQQKAKEVK
ncbi:50S ribosomal protein L10 [Candidatus Roizmanbacteria bacterium]|nr:50S ribosomal protein L10 [Candidatus Roizmanbacteria bacterium]